jgi:NADH dehydrogenase FAD-containing subunit
MNTDFLLIGGGCGGLETALHLRKLVADATITIVNPQPHLIYRPWLIYLPAQRRRLEDLQIFLHNVATRYRLHLVIDTVRQLDPQNQCAKLSDGEVITYRSAVVATGAPADRERLPGSAQHALFPCDVEEALALQERFLALTQGHVSVIIAGERPGPGLEYAGWLATAVQERGLSGQLHIHVVDDRGSLRARLGDNAMDIVAGFLAKKGATLIRGQAVRGVHAEGIELENGTAWDSVLTAVVGPLRGADLALPSPIVDEQNFVRVQPTFQSESQPDLFAVGDAVRFPTGSALPKSWMLTRRLAPLVAQNLVAYARGQDLSHFDVEKARRAAGIAIPDCGGQTVMVRNGRVLARGSFPLLLRAMVDRRSLKGRRERRKGV